MSKELEQKTNETVETPEVKTEPAVDRKGVVSRCNRLNIRKAPNKDADVVKIVPVGAEMTIVGHSLDKPWYRVVTEDGIKGFCMAEYINVVR